MRANGAIGLGSASRDRVDAPREPSWPRQRGLTRERDSLRRVPACNFRRPAGETLSGKLDLD